MVYELKTTFAVDRINHHLVRSNETIIANAKDFDDVMRKDPYFIITGVVSLDGPDSHAVVQVWDLYD